MNDQVRRHAARHRVNGFGPEDGCPKGVPLFIAHGLKLASDFRTHLFIVLGQHHPPGLAPLDVEEDAGVIAPLAPADGARPVYFCLGQRDDARGLFQQGEIPFLHEPFIDAHPALHRLRPVIGYDEGDGVVAGQGQQLSQLPVKILVIVKHRIGVGGARFMLAVAGVEIFPEAVMHPVRPDLHHHEEIPGLGAEQVFCHAEPLGGHVIDLLQQQLLILGPEIVHVEQVRAYQPVHFFLELGGMGIAAAAVRC